MGINELDFMVRGIETPNTDFSEVAELQARFAQGLQSIAALPVIYKEQSTDIVISNQTTFQDITDLSLSISSNQKWIVWACIAANCPATAHIQFAATFPVGCVASFFSFGPGSDTASGAANYNVNLRSQVIVPASNVIGALVGGNLPAGLGGPLSTFLPIIVSNGGNAGIFQLRFAQEVAVVGNTTIFGRSGTHPASFFLAFNVT